MSYSQHLMIKRYEYASPADAVNDDWTRHGTYEHINPYTNWLDIVDMWRHCVLVPERYIAVHMTVQFGYVHYKSNTCWIICRHGILLAGGCERKCILMSMECIALLQHGIVSLLGHTIQPLRYRNTYTYKSIASFINMSIGAQNKESSRCKSMSSKRTHKLHSCISCLWRKVNVRIEWSYNKGMLTTVWYAVTYQCQVWTWTSQCILIVQYIMVDQYTINIVISVALYEPIQMMK